MGTFNASGTVLTFHGRRLDPSEEDADVFRNRGVWRLVSPNEHVYAAYGNRPSGEASRVKMHRTRPRTLNF